ncbi:MAG: GTPase HflX [Chloroflexota bacterium]|nr:GTPase HflX [Chloroflexota bacterium]
MIHKSRKRSRSVDVKPRKERTLLFGVDIKSRFPGVWRTKESLKELKALVNSAGATVVEVQSQRVGKRKPTYMGIGKIEELKYLVNDKKIDTIVLDDELSPAQQRNLENLLEIKVVDRTALILDIFAQRAQTREGRLQVELAQLDYLLPRLVGQWSHLERLGGGIGTRGPGESQLETDRRLLRKRVDKIRQELENVRRRRGQARQNRFEQGIPVVSLVGYTNSGKSTLMNALTRAHVVAEDKLFATLDPVTRKMPLTSGRMSLISDTVGFINKLPTSLVAAFRATLEELRDADILLHVIDISNTNALAQYESVVELLKDLDLMNTPTIHVLNKVDVMVPSEVSGYEATITEAASTYYESPESVSISAVSRFNLEELLQLIDIKVTDKSLI